MSQVTIEQLQQVDLLSELPVASLSELAAGATMERFEPGHVLFRQGDTGDKLYLVTVGIIKIVLTRPDGSDLVLETERPGDVFGELAVLNRTPRLASAIAIDRSETIAIATQLLEDVLDRHPDATRVLLGSLARNLATAKQRVTYNNEILDKQVRERTLELSETRLEIIRRLGRAAEFRDDDTGLHITRMSQVAAMLARAIGFPEDECHDLLQAAPMHDVGKIGIPDRILLKPGKLDPDEFEIMKTHTTIGGELLSGSDAPLMKMAHEIALNHHEKWNGAGYPQGRSGEDIPMTSRICAICDVFDALISERPYKKPWTIEDAIDLIQKEAGTHFDPKLVEPFLAIEDDIRDFLMQLEKKHEVEGGDQAGAISDYGNR
jgi:HD-GYP domain-containing protein (c-di-GMP phosphodiesterase class II)